MPSTTNALSPAGSGIGGNSGPNSQTSMSQQHSPHAPGMGVKPGTSTPPERVLQVLKQVSIIIIIMCVDIAYPFFFCACY